MTLSPSRRRTPNNDSAPIQLGEEWPPFLVLASLALLFLSQTPSVPPLAQMGCVLGGTGGFVATLALCRNFAENMRRAVFKGPTLLLMLLTAWTVFRFFTTPTAYKLLATTDLLRVVGGTLAYFCAAYALPTVRQAGRLIVGITLCAVFVAFADFTYFGATAAKTNYYVHNTSILGLHMTVGGFLAMLVPVIAALSFAPGLDDKQRLASQLAFLVLAFALVLSRARSGWMGGAVALLVVAALIGLLALRERWRRGAEPQPRRRRSENLVVRLINSPLLFVVLGLIVLIVGGGLTGVLSGRAGTIGHVLEGQITQRGDHTFWQRLRFWRGALLMIHASPATGRGLGAYLVEQGRWTHDGDEAIQVLRLGTGHQNRAHNYYLQWAADAGLIGLFLHVAFLAVWTAAMVRGIPVAGSPERRAIAIGAVGAMAAAAVDGLASPMYHMHGNYTLLLTWLGMGIGALRSDPPRHGVSITFSRGDADSAPPVDDMPAIREATPLSHWATGVAVGGAAAYLLLFLGGRIIAQGKKMPPGSLRVEVVPAVWQVRPGTPVVFKAIFIDQDGEEISTVPGTEWTVYGGDDILKAPGAGFLRLDAPRYEHGGKNYKAAHAGLRLVPPPGAKSSAVTVFATYHDSWGRTYKKAATVAVRNDAPAIVPLTMPRWRDGADVVPQAAPTPTPTPSPSR